jgi:DNA-binding transcriptional LysR family regulator
MICRCGSIREAARQLHVDSSAVNRQLLNLEEGVGATLFERLPGGLRLTEAGRIFQQHVALVMRDAQRTQNELAQLLTGERGDVYIAAAESLNTGFLPPVLEKTSLEHPHLQIHASTQGSESIVDLVTTEQVDVGVGFAVETKPDLTYVARGEFRLGAVMTASHPLAARRRLSFEECLPYGLIMPNTELATYAVLGPLIQRTQQPIRVVAHCGTLELIHQIAKRSTNIGFQTRIGLAPLCEAGQLVFVPLDEAEQAIVQLNIFVRTGRHLSAGVQTVLAMLTEQLAELLDEERHADRPRMPH